VAAHQTFGFHPKLQLKNHAATEELVDNVLLNSAAIFAYYSYFYYYYYYYYYY